MKKEKLLKVLDEKIEAENNKRKMLGDDAFDPTRIMTLYEIRDFIEWEDE